MTGENEVVKVVLEKIEQRLKLQDMRAFLDNQNIVSNKSKDTRGALQAGETPIDIARRLPDTETRANLLRVYRTSHLWCIICAF